MGRRRAPELVGVFERLSEEALRDAGIQRRDSAAGDHLPLVLDVRPFAKSSVTGAE